MSSERPFEVRPMRGDDADLRRMKRCFDENDSPRDLDHLSWQYLDRPGEVLNEVAAAKDGDDELFAGVYASFPSRFWAHGREVMAVQGVDLMTDHRFRKRGIFKTLALSNYERLEAEGMACIYGFPNGAAINGYRKYLSWTILDPVPFMIRPLRTGYVFKKLGLERVPRLLDLPVPARLCVSERGVEIREIDAFDDAFDRLWATTAPLIDVGVVRDRAYLAWRFDRNPRFDYVRLAAYRGDTLLGFVVYRVADKHGGRIGYVMELLEKPGAGVMKALLARALQAMQRDGAEVVLAWNMAHSFNHSAHVRLGFLPLPERLRPIELHFGLRPFNGHALTTREDWYLSYCDSDTV